MVVYGSSDDGGNDDGMQDGGIATDCSWAKRTNPVLDLVSDWYSELEISVGDSGPSSCSTYTVY